MTWFQEKLFFSASIGLSAAVSWIGAIVSTGDARWIYVTLSSSILMAAFLALVVRQSGETIQLTVGRCGIAILGGVLGTRLGIGLLNEEVIHSDMIYLAGVSSLFCVGAFLLGVAFLRAVDQSSTHIAKRALDWMLSRFFK
jgi:hypothetical protein